VENSKDKKIALEMWGIAHLFAAILSFVLVVILFFKPDFVNINPVTICWFGAYCGSQYALYRAKTGKG
jgi:hypothetical protein